MHQAREPPCQRIGRCAKINHMAASQGNVGRHAQADLRLRRTGGACELRDVCRAEATAKEAGTAEATASRWACTSCQSACSRTRMLSPQQKHYTTHEELRAPRLLPARLHCRAVHAERPPEGPELVEDVPHADARELEPAAGQRDLPRVPGGVVAAGGGALLPCPWEDPSLGERTCSGGPGELLFF